VAVIIDGTKIAEQIRAEVKEEVEELKKEKDITPGLAVILVGENPASQVYVNSKAKACGQVGIYSETIFKPEETTTEEVLREIELLNQREDIHGTLVQLPLPKQIHENQVLPAVDPSKDVDGFHPVNVGKLCLKQEGFVPATPSGIIEILKRMNIQIEGKEAVVIGRSDIVGKPMALLLLHNNATVTVCHSRTVNLPSVARRADILVVAIGRPAMVKGDWVKPGAAVIDVGTNRVTADKAWEELKEDPKRAKDLETKGSTLVGDVDEYSVGPVAGYLTPVPGGVGPLTIAMLLKNTLLAAKRSLR
jgi:methylenetetrahydrofolate dehydrogenase (NADP+)/methenyltetrahydrofolate cyclohydrolase